MGRGFRPGGRGTLGPVDAVVIGAGVNGLTAAALLADAGWTVQVLEAGDQVGGACRSAEVTAPGYLSDLFSSFYPLGYASPVLRALHLERHGLRWLRAPAVLAHPLPDDPGVVLSTDPAATGRSLDRFAAGDGAAWDLLYREWQQVGGPLLAGLLRPFPPLRAGWGLLRAAGAGGTLRLARTLALPARRLAEEHFAGEGAALLLAGNAMHTDLGPDAAASGGYGWLLAMLGQDVGFPVPAGGAGQLSAALADRARAAGAQIATGTPVSRVVVRGGRAVGVQLAGGGEVPATRAVLAGIDAPQLYRDLVGEQHLPGRFLADLRRFQWDNSTVKVDWALDGPIPWADPACAGAGTVHLGGDLDQMSVTAGQLARRLVPAEPFVLLGQMTTADPSRSPAGTESAWGYLHVPQHPRGDAAGGPDPVRGSWDADDVRRLVDRLEQRVERHAPGFLGRIRARHVQGPLGLQDADRSLHRGALNGGTAAIHQQLVFRPTPGLGRAETPLPGLYLASASAHPGGGVHGGPGANAARAALAAHGLLGPAQRGLIRASHRLLYGDPGDGPGGAAG